MSHTYEASCVTCGERSLVPWIGADETCPHCGGQRFEPSNIHGPDDLVISRAPDGSAQWDRDDEHDGEGGDHRV